MPYEPEYDPDLIARIYAVDDSEYAENTIKAHLDRHDGYYAASSPYAPGSRESTVSPRSPAQYETFLELRFGRGPRTGRGFVFGMAFSCDVILPPKRGLSNQHFAIIFDDLGRLLVRDFSRNGTAVAYDGRGQYVRRNFDWIIGGDPEVDKMNNITIPLIHIRIEPNRDIFTSPDHLEKVAAFHSGNATPNELLTDLTVAGHTTEPGTSSQTPGPRRIILEIAHIATGGFLLCW
ncbi:unnamed protein product [Discula destructiva]